MGSGNNGEKPTVLVLGMPRSGTTWLGKMLDCHPEAFYLHEPDAAVLSSQLPIFFIEGDVRKEHVERVRAFFQSLPSRAPVRSYTRLPLYRKSYYKKSTWVSIHILALLERIFKSLSRMPIHQGLICIPQHITSVVKSVESFGRIPLFLNSINDLKIIYILRHPCGVRYSLLRGERMGKFTNNTSVTESVPRLKQLVKLEGARKRELSLPLLLAQTASQRFAYWWLLANEKAVGECANTSRAKVVVYEKLCTDTLKTMAEIYDFLGWKFSEGIKAQIVSTTKRNDSRYYSVFKDPQKTMNAWKQGLGREEASMILEILASSPLESFWSEVTSQNLVRS